jgi:hypothetical protein
MYHSGAELRIQKSVERTQMKYINDESKGKDGANLHNASFVRPVDIR